MFLSTPEDKETINLDNPIKNDKRSEGGRTVPLLYGTPRYFAREVLEEVARDKSIAWTTELERRERAFQSR